MAGGPEREHPPKPGQTELPAKRGEITPRVLLPQEEKGWQDRSHEELVRGFREYYERRVQEIPPGLKRGGLYFPEKIMRDELTRHIPYGEGRIDIEEREAFFRPIIRAWDALAYDRYEPGSPLEEWVRLDLWSHHEAYQESIKLTDSLQVRIIDALTEVFGIPHQRGQTAIEIPEKLRDYYEYQQSQEYKDRVAQARAQRQRRR